jgi:hypothetical protein
LAQHIFSTAVEKKADPSLVLRMTAVKPGVTQVYVQQNKPGTIFTSCHSEERRDEESAFIG